PGRARAGVHAAAQVPLPRQLPDERQRQGRPAQAGRAAGRGHRRPRLAASGSGGFRMVPFADFLYFGVALYVVLPTLLVGLTGRFTRLWMLLATLLMLAVQYGGTVPVGAGLVVRESWLAAGYAAFQGLVAAAFLRLRGGVKGRWPYHA